MSATCEQITTDYCPAVWNLTCLYVGFSYTNTIDFAEADGTAINISADTFSMPITNSLGVLVETLTLGSGLAILGTGTLQITIGALTTTNAGTYTHRIIWEEAATGATAPVAIGKIIVKP